MLVKNEKPEKEKESSFETELEKIDKLVEELEQTKGLQSEPEQNVTETEQIEPLKTENDNGQLKELDMFRKLHETESFEMSEITSDYLELKDGQVYNMLCLGIVRHKKKDGQVIDCVDLKDEFGKRFKNGSVTLVTKIREYMDSNPTIDIFPVRIVSRGTKKGANGNYSDISVYVF